MINIPIGHPKALEYFDDTNNTSGTPDSTKGYWFDNTGAAVSASYGAPKSTILLSAGDELHVTYRDMQITSFFVLCDNESPRTYLFTPTSASPFTLNLTTPSETPWIISINDVINGNADAKDANGYTNIIASATGPAYISTCMNRFTRNEAYRECKLDKYEVHRTNGEIINLMDYNLVDWYDSYEVGGEQQIPYNEIDWSKQSIDFTTGVAQLPGTPTDDHTLLQVGGVITTQQTILPSSFNGYNINFDGNWFVTTDRRAADTIQLPTVVSGDEYTVTFQNFDVKMYNEKNAFYIAFIGWANKGEYMNVIVKNNKCVGNNISGAFLYTFNTPSATYEVYNNFARGVAMAYGTQGTHGNGKYENNTSVDCDYAFYGLDSKISAANCYGDSSVDVFFTQPFDGGGNASSDATAPEAQYQNIVMSAALSSPDNYRYTPRRGGLLKDGVTPTIDGHDSYIDGTPITSPYYIGAYAPPVPNYSYIPIGHPKALHYFNDVNNTSGNPDRNKGYWFDRFDISYGKLISPITLQIGDEIRITIKDFSRIASTVYLIDKNAPRNYVLTNSDGPYVPTVGYSDVTVNGVLNGDSSAADENGYQQISFTALSAQDIDVLLGRYSLDTAQQLEGKVDSYKVHRTTGEVIDLMDYDITMWFETYEVGGKQNIPYNSFDWSKQSLDYATGVSQLPGNPVNDWMLAQVGGVIGTSTANLPTTFDGYTLDVNGNGFKFTSTITSDDMLITDSLAGNVNVYNQDAIFNVTKTDIFGAMLRTNNSQNLNINIHDNKLTGKDKMGALAVVWFGSFLLNGYNNFIKDSGWGIGVHITEPEHAKSVIENMTVVGNDIGFYSSAGITKLINCYLDGSTRSIYAITGFITDGGGNASTDATAPEAQYRNIALSAALVDTDNYNYFPIANGPLKIGVAPTINDHTTYLDGARLIIPYYSGCYSTGVTGKPNSGGGGLYRWGWRWSIV